MAVAEMFGEACPASAPFFGYMGAAAALIFASKLFVCSFLSAVCPRMELRPKRGSATMPFGLFTLEGLCTLEMSTCAGPRKYTMCGGMWDVVACLGCWHCVWYEVPRERCRYRVYSKGGGIRIKKIHNGLPYSIFCGLSYIRFHTSHRSYPVRPVTQASVNTECLTLLGNRCAFFCGEALPLLHRSHVAACMCLSLSPEFSGVFYLRGSVLTKIAAFYLWRKRELAQFSCHEWPDNFTDRALSVSLCLYSAHLSWLQTSALPTALRSPALASAPWA